MKDNGFEAFLHNERCFNPKNFKKNAINFFGDARETNILFVPADRLPAFRERCKYLKDLIPVRTLDDLALGMLKKPSYKYDALAPSSAAQILGVDFFANEPELRQLEKSLQAQLQQIQRSIPMQLASRYQRIVERLLLRGTRRRYYYELCLSCIRIILNEGWKSFFRGLKAYLRGRRNTAGKVV